MGAIVGNTFYFDFEVRIMEFLQGLLGESGAKVFSFITLFGEETILILLLGFLYWCYDKKMGSYVGTLIVTGCVINPMIKNIFWRRRPYFDHESIKCFKPVDADADIYDIAAQGFSFPSGHSTNSVTVYGGMAKYKTNRVTKILSVMMPLLIGVSRVVVGVHYPTDVLCGWLLGLICLFGIGTLMERIPEEKSWIMHLGIFLVSCLGLLYCKTTDYYSALGLMGGLFAAIEFEKRYVKFENTREPLKCILRLACGIAIYLVLNTLLKLPFSKEFLASGTFAAGMVRVVRYLIVSFITIGVYPLIFNLFKKK